MEYNSLKGYIYVRNHESYEKYNCYKLGKTINLISRDYQYSTGEIIRGTYKYIVELDVCKLNIIEKLLQNYFKSLNYYVRYNAGIEFYTIKLMEQELKGTYNQQKSTKREGLENIPTEKLEALKMELQRMIKLENFDAAKVIKSQIDDLLKG